MLKKLHEWRVFYEYPLKAVRDESGLPLYSQRIAQFEE